MDDVKKRLEEGLGLVTPHTCHQIVEMVHRVEQALRWSTASVYDRADNMTGATSSSSTPSDMSDSDS